MNHVQHVLLSMLLALVCYLTFQNQQLRTELAALNALQQDSAMVLTTTLAPLTAQLEAIHTVTSKLRQEADEASKKKLTAMQQRIDLYQLLSTVNQANQLRAAGKGTEAAEKLGSTKKPIWQAGDTFSAHKARLQGLMGTIDKLVTAWKNGDTTTTPDTVRKELETVLGELNNEQK